MEESTITKTLSLDDTDNKNLMMCCHKSGDVLLSVHDVTKCKVSKWRFLRIDEDNKKVYTKDITAFQNGKKTEIILFKTE